MTIGAAADAHVVENHPGWTYGPDPLLYTMGRSGYRSESFLRFVVPAQTGKIVAARVRLRAHTGTVNGPAITRASTVWTESSVTWRTRPAAIGSTMADAGGIAAGSWTDWVVTPAVAAAGTYAFRLAGGSTSDSVYFSSRTASTGSYRPQLVLTVDVPDAPVADTTAPAVALTAPASGVTVTGTVPVTATASDNIGVARVEFSLDGRVTGSDVSAPYASAVDASGLTPGAHTVAVRAFDAAGNASPLSSRVVHVAAVADTTAPTLTLVRSAGTPGVAGEIGALATASDNVAVTHVIFAVDGVDRAPDTTAPYSLTLLESSLATGVHTITARAFDAAGNVSVTGSITFTVPGEAPQSNHPVRPCTFYVSPTGGSSNTGRSISSPLPLRTAAARTLPGDVVCLLDGDYVMSSTLHITRSGTSTDWITYRGYGDDARLLWTGSTEALMFEMSNGSHHIEVRDLYFDGKYVAVAALKCGNGGSHHMRAIGNTVKNMGSGGIGGKYCDHMTIDSNLIHDFGRGVGWASGVYLNLNVWSDQAPGFHSIVTNNIISGGTDESDYHTDGGGIIVDRGGNTPPALIANNVVYQNGARCIHNFIAQHVWVVNNTCYKNALDLRIGGGGGMGEFTNYNAQDVHLINNVAYAWNQQAPFKVEKGSVATLHRNVAFAGGSNIGVTSSDPNQVRRSDPLFIAAPYLHPTNGQQQLTSLAPWLIGRGLDVRAGSPLVDAGVDPRSVPGVTSSFRATMDKYLTTDINGVERGTGAGWDIGAYEH